MSVLTNLSSGKGDLRRSMQVTLQDFEKRWEKCFGGLSKDGRNSGFKNSKDRRRNKKGLQR